LPTPPPIEESSHPSRAPLIKEIVMDQKTIVFHIGACKRQGLPKLMCQDWFLQWDIRVSLSQIDAIYDGESTCTVA
jgi:hypothetical protein